MFLDVLHIIAHWSMKEWKNCLVKILRMIQILSFAFSCAGQTEANHFNQQGIWKDKDTSISTLRFFITTHPTSCHRPHGETHAVGMGRGVQNNRSVTKRGCHRPLWALWGPSSIQCKCAVWGIMKIRVSAPLQPLMDRNEHLKHFSRRPRMPLPQQLTNLKW